MLAHYKLPPCPRFRFVIRRNNLYSGSKTNNSWSSLVDFVQHVTQGFEKVISVIFQTAKTISKTSLTQTKASIKQTLAKERNVIAKTIDSCLPIN